MIETMSESHYSNMTNFSNKLIQGKYRLKEPIGEGSFGMIYKAESESGLYAIKFEKKRPNKRSLLESESKIMSYLKGPGIPKIYSYSVYNDYNIMVMQLLGKNLNSLLNKTKDKKLSLKTVCMLGIEMIKILKYIHDKHIIHRDIKPDNFTMDYEHGKTLYLLDFGLAKQYRSSKTLIHYDMKKNKKLTGTARYASINALRGNEQSRRDDLESIGYVLIYLLNGNLPWQGIDAKTKEEKYAKILNKKEIISPEELCKESPEELVLFLKYTQNLEYSKDPKYDYLIELLEKIIKNKLNEIIDYRYDWIKDRDNRQKEKDYNNTSLFIEENNKNKLNITTINNINNTTLGINEIREQIKKNMENVENNLINNNNQNININISININNNNINISNDNINENEDKGKIKKNIKNGALKNKAYNDKKNKEKNEEEDDNYYEGIMKEYNTHETENININPDINELNKKLCCLMF